MPINSYYREPWGNLLSTLKESGAHFSVVSDHSEIASIVDDLQSIFVFSKFGEIDKSAYKCSDYCDFFWSNWEQEISAFREALGQGYKWMQPDKEFALLVFDENSLPVIRMNWNDISDFDEQILELENGWIVSEGGSVVVERRRVGLTVCFRNI